MQSRQAGCRRAASRIIWLIRIPAPEGDRDRDGTRNRAGDHRHRERNGGDRYGYGAGDGNQAGDRTRIRTRDICVRPRDGQCDRSGNDSNGGRRRLCIGIDGRHGGHFPAGTADSRVGLRGAAAPGVRALRIAPCGRTDKMDRTEHRFSPSGRLPGGDFRVRRQSCQQDGAEQQRERAAPPGHVCASAHGGVSGAQSRFAGADCPAGQPCRPADCRAPCRMESVHVSPPLPLRQCMRRGAFSCGRGDCPAGACLLHPRAEPGRRLQPQQKRYPAGGLPCLPPADHAFSLFSFPHPPDPLPLRGRGRLKSLFRRGLRPRHPGIRPPAALVRPAAVVLNGGACPCAALAIPAPGRGPSQTPKFLSPVPLSLAAGTAHREPLPVVFAANRKLLAWGARMAGTISAANGLMQGCRGRSPRRNKL